MVTDHTEIRSRLARLSAPDLARLHWRLRWADQSREKQRPPEGAWNVWLLRAGRGFGKSRTGAEWLAAETWDDPGSLSAVVAPTHGDLIGTCFEGESGLMNVIPNELIANYVKSSPHTKITLVNGSSIMGYAADTPERLRGPNFSRAWLDEMASWKYLEYAYDMVSFAVRIGHSKIVATTTPKPLKFLRDMSAKAGVLTTTGSTYENRDNLSKNFFDKIAIYEGTQIGKQEIYGELLDMEEYGVFKRSWFKLWHHEDERGKEIPFPKFQYIIQSYDTGFKTNVMNDPTACTVWGVFRPDNKSPLALMLLDCWAEKLEYPDLREKAAKEWGYKYGPDERWPDVVLVEDKGSGQSLIQDLGRAGINVAKYNPGRDDKLLRANVASPYVKAGFIYLPESTKKPGEFRPWVNPFLEEVCTFGPQTLDMDGQHDDYVDSFVQALHYFKDSDFLRMPKDPVDETPDEKPRRVNPYAA